jgi:preprotein translocase subunit SecE
MIGTRLMMIGMIAVFVVLLYGLDKIFDKFDQTKD